MTKVMSKKGKTSSGDRQDKRPFLRDRLMASHHGHYNNSFNKREFSRGKLSHYKREMENKA